MKKHRPKQIAPRLASGERRVAFGHGLPEAVKIGIQAIAEHENKSASWVMEEVVYKYFGIDRPKFKDRKPQGKRSR